MLVDAIGRIVHRANQFAKFIHVVLGPVSWRAVTVIDIKIGFISDLNTEEVFP